MRERRGEGEAGCVRVSCAGVARSFWGCPGHCTAVLGACLTPTERETSLHQPTTAHTSVQRTRRHSLPALQLYIYTMSQVSASKQVLSRWGLRFY